MNTLFPYHIFFEIHAPPILFQVEFFEKIVIYPFTSTWYVSKYSFVAHNCLSVCLSVDMLVYFLFPFRLCSFMCSPPPPPPPHACMNKSNNFFRHRFKAIGGPRVFLQVWLTFIYLLFMNEFLELTKRFLRSKKNLFSFWRCFSLEGLVLGAHFKCEFGNFSKLAFKI